MGGSKKIVLYDNLIKQHLGFSDYENVMEKMREKFKQIQVKNTSWAGLNIGIHRNILHMPTTIPENKDSHF